MEGGSAEKGWCGGNCTPQSVNQRGGSTGKGWCGGNYTTPLPTNLSIILKKENSKVN